MMPNDDDHRVERTSVDAWEISGQEVTQAGARLEGTGKRREGDRLRRLFFSHGQTLASMRARTRGRAREGASLAMATALWGSRPQNAVVLRALDARLARPTTDVKKWRASSPELAGPSDVAIAGRSETRSSR
jgi:hypothetical protein